MDSMTPDELDRDQPITEDSRIKRIAKGSGTSIMEVKILLEEHKKIRGLVEQVKKTNLGKNDKPQNFMRNQPQIMDKLSRMMNPQMMAQLGGASNIMGMMKEMTTNPQMQEMMKAMGGGMGGLGGLGDMGGKGKKGKGKK